MNNYDELLRRLEYVAEKGITAELRDLARQSADALEALQAERDELKFAYTESARQRNELLTAHKVNARERDALQARLKALEKQEPVALLRELRDALVLSDKYPGQCGTWEQWIAKIDAVPASGKVFPDKKTLDYEAEHPAAKRMRLEFEARYGDMANVMRAMNHWNGTRTEWNESYNRDREKPITDDDVEMALQSVFAAVRAVTPASAAVPEASCALGSANCACGTPNICCDHYIEPDEAEPPASEPRPVNCGTGHCSCIECVMEPELSTDELNQMWRDAVDRADPTAGNAHLLFYRAVLASREER